VTAQTHTKFPPLFNSLALVTVTLGGLFDDQQLDLKRGPGGFSRLHSFSAAARHQHGLRKYFSCIAERFSCIAERFSCIAEGKDVSTKFGIPTNPVSKKLSVRRVYSQKPPSVSVHLAAQFDARSLPSSRNPDPSLDHAPAPFVTDR